MKWVSALFIGVLLTACASHDSLEQKEQKRQSYVKMLEVMQKQEKEQLALSLISKTFNLGVSFKSLPLKTVTKQDTLARYYYLGHRDKLNVSLNIDDPHCDVEDTDENHYKCIMPKIMANPMIEIIKPTISLKNKEDGVSLSYIAFVLAGDKKIKVLHNHFLFSKNGKWGDFHVSMLHPTQAELLMMLKFPTHVKLIEN